jgi:hypothetical protein
MNIILLLLFMPAEKSKKQTQYNTIIILNNLLSKAFLAVCIVHYTSMMSSTNAAATMDMTVKLGITLPRSIIQKIDNKRGDIPRSRFIRSAIESYLDKGMSKK